MLRTDQVELAILNLLIDWSDADGRSFSITQLRSLLSDRIGYVSDREVDDAIPLLVEDKLIAVDRYQESGFVPYDASKGTVFFYEQPFRCRALAKARRRQQQLAKGNRHGIFISHISEERPVALRIQRLFREALSESLPVFVSSDRKSIGSGEPWYAAILEGLHKSQAVVSLLSLTSIDRRRINFEAGIGMGQESRVMPVVWRGLPKGEVGMPLEHLQIRDLHNEDDLKALLQDLASTCGTPFSETPIAAFLQDLPALEVGIPKEGLFASLFREGQRVRMTIQNTGTRLVELVEAEMLVPEALSGNNNFQEYQPVLQRRRVTEAVSGTWDRDSLQSLVRFFTSVSIL